MGDRSAYQEIFAEESREFLSLLDDGLRAMEARPDDNLAIDAVFRGAHSLKGMCAAMGYQRSAELAAAMERLMGHVRAGDVAVTGDLLLSMKGAMHAVTACVEADVAGSHDAGIDMPDLDPARFGLPAADAGVRERVRLVFFFLTLDDACTLKAVRAHVVLKRLALLGEVTGSEPTPACLQEERFDRSFTVTVRTGRPLEEIVTAVRGIAEVADVTAEQLIASTAEEDVPAFSEMQIDALGEVGNIGAGHAATALSELLGKRIALSQPVLHVVPASEMPYALGISKTLVGAVYSRLSGDLGGGILSLATHNALLLLADLANGRPVGSTHSFTAREEELFVKVGSALAEAYVGAVSLMTGLTITLVDSAFEFDHAGSILARVATDIALDPPWAALVRTTLTAENQSIDVAIIFIPDQPSISSLFERLGLA